MTSRAHDLQRLLAEEPFVRALAHSLVADEADDVVQQAWLRAIEHDGGAIRQPRSWLARVVHNLVADRRRRGERREIRHRAVMPDVHVPSSSELLEGEERRAALVAAVDALPHDQRTVVLLRYYDGLPSRRIAAHLGVPVQTVWNRLHGALQTLRARLDATHGDRRAWLLPLVPFATKPCALPWRELVMPAAKTFCLGAIVMTAKTKIVMAVASVLVVALAWIAWPRDEVPGNLPLTPAAGAGGPVAQHDLGAGRGVGSTADAPAREAADAPKVPAATTGSLLVRVRYADEPTAAAGIPITVMRPGGDFRVGVHRAVTDAEGNARVDGLDPGPVRLWATAHAMQSAKAEIAAGSTCEYTLQLHGGMTLTGIVVDASGVPIGGALVESTMANVTGVDADQVAVTGPDGTFTIRECYTCCVVGARAEGHAASPLYFRQGQRGSTEQVRIELRPNGGAVEGLVVGSTGKPVAGAIVRVGEGRTESILTTMQGGPPLPAQVRTDAAGRFRAIGVPAGAQPVQVRTVDFAPWLGTCDVATGQTVALRIDLVAGVACSGIVRNGDGQPVPDASISLGDTGDFVLLRTRSAADGTFHLAGLPVGAFELAASKEGVGKTTASLRGQPGETLRCELQLSNGLTLRGRVLDEAEAPFAMVEVRCWTEDTGPRWTSHKFTDKAGRFLIAECPPGRLLTVVAGVRDYVTDVRHGVDPRSGELTIALARDVAPKARITGRLLRPDGSAATGENVEAVSSQTETQQQRNAGAGVQSDGSFVLELQAGAWQGRILTKGHPDIRLGPWTLAAGAAIDLGTLQITVGGTLLVRDDGSQGKLDYFVLDARERGVCSLWSPTPQPLSPLLAPGDYLLSAQGEGFAAQVVPFTIRSGGETALTVPRIPGVRQGIEFELPAGAAPAPYVAFRVRRDGKLATSSYASGEKQLRGEVWLAPGTYTLATENREPQTTATFTVGTTEGPPLRVALR